MSHDGEAWQDKPPVRGALVDTLYPYWRLVERTEGQESVRVIEWYVLTDMDGKVPGAEE